MSLQALAERPATHQAKAVAKRSARTRVTGPLKEALDYLVFTGVKTDLAAAAAHAGITAHAIRCALEKPHVKAYYEAQLVVLRTSERARNIHTLLAVRDQENNQMARVNAVQALERIEDQSLSAGHQRSAPGLVIVIEAGAVMGHIPQQAPKPLIEHEVPRPSDRDRDR